MSTRKILPFIISVLMSVALIMGVAGCEFEDLFEADEPAVVQYEISFDALNGSAVKTIKVDEGSNIEPIENPYKDDFIFAGWYEEPEYYGNAADFKNSPVKATRDMIYYAKWIEPDKTAIHFIGFGDNMPEDFEVNVGDTINFSQIENPTRDGYNFKGWANDEMEIVSSITAEGEEMYIIPYWAAVYTYTYVINGNDYVVMEGASVEDYDGDNIINIEIPDYDTNDYQFVNFTIDGQEIEEGEYVVKSNVEINVNFIYAYNVSFDLNYEGAAEIDTQRILEGDDATVEIPEREGYRFMGWNVEVNDQQTGTVAADATAYKPSAHTALVANWAYIYTVTLVAGENGSVENATIQGIEGEVVTLPNATPYAYDYRFYGWFTDEGFDGEREATSYSIPGDITLYAKITEIAKFSVKFHIMGDDYDTDSELTNVLDGTPMTADQLAPAPQVEGYGFLCWSLNGEQISENSFKDDNGNDLIIVDQDLVFEALMINIAGSIGYRFEIETNAILEGYSTGSGGGDKKFLETGNLNNFPGQIVAGGLGNGTATGNPGATNIEFHIYAEEAVSVFAALALSPGYGQSLKLMVDGVDYEIYLNGERVHFSSYNLPLLSGQNWNLYWGTAWFTMDLAQGDNVVKFVRPNITLGFPNIDYMELISTVPLRQSMSEGVTTVTFELDGGEFAENGTITNDQGVNVLLPNLPNEEGKVNLYVGHTLYTARPTANPATTVTGIVHLWRMADPVKDGFIFTGWQWSGDNGATWQAVGNNTTTIVENMIIKATWADSKTIHYIMQDGSTHDELAIANSTVSSLYVPAAIPGYLFRGWYSDEEHNNKVTSVFMEDDVTLYGLWEEGFTITLNVNGGNALNPSVYEFAVGQTLHTYDLPIPTRNNYRFNGWFTATSGGVEFPNWIAQNPNNAASVTFYAQWTSNARQLTLNMNGGTFDREEAARAHLRQSGNNWIYMYIRNNERRSAAAANIPTPTRSGYTFRGWSTNSSSYTFSANQNVGSSNTNWYAFWNQNTSSTNFATTLNYVTLEASVELPTVFTAGGNTAPELIPNAVFDMPAIIEEDKMAKLFRA